MKKIFFNRLEKNNGVHKEVLNPDVPYVISFIDGVNNSSKVYTMEITMNNEEIVGNNDMDVTFYVTHNIAGRVSKHKLSERAVLTLPDGILKEFDTAINRFILGEDFDDE